MKKICLAERLLASQELLCSVKLLSTAAVQGKTKGNINDVTNIRQETQLKGLLHTGGDRLS
jgi:hypothetical protein